MSRMARPTTRSGAGAALDARHARLHRRRRPEWDARLLRWDVLGSLGHVEGLRASGLLTGADMPGSGAGSAPPSARPAAAPCASSAPSTRTLHSAVELWLTRRAPGAGERLHTGRSRNDQVACDLRLFLKDRLLALHGAALVVVAALLALPSGTVPSLWPGYTHPRRAMPSSAGLWARRTPRDCSIPSKRCRRSGPGWTARRWAARRVMGFRFRSAARPPPARSALPGSTTTWPRCRTGAASSRPAALFWCVQLGHELARLSADVILYSAEEFGFLGLPAGLATGSSIMPHKRNPDLFELTRGAGGGARGRSRGRACASGPSSASGYHRDFQLLKEPLIRGLERTEEMLGDAGARGAPARRGPRARRCGARRRRARHRRGDAPGGSRTAVPAGLSRSGGGAQAGRAIPAPSPRAAGGAAALDRRLGQARTAGAAGAAPARAALERAGAARGSTARCKLAGLRARRRRR